MGDDCGHGVYQLLFSADGRYLFSAARKSDSIDQWDLGNGEKTFSYTRKLSSFQKVRFGIGTALSEQDVWTDYLVTGDEVTILPFPFLI